MTGRALCDTIKGTFEYEPVRSAGAEYPFSAISSQGESLVSEGSVSLLSEVATGESAYVLEYVIQDEAAGILLEGGLSLEAYAL